MAAWTDHRSATQCAMRDSQSERESSSCRRSDEHTSTRAAMHAIATMTAAMAGAAAAAPMARERSR